MVSAMIHGKTLVIVMPAYNAADTLTRTYEALPHDIVDTANITGLHLLDGTRLDRRGCRRVHHGAGAVERRTHRVGIRNVSLHNLWTRLPGTEQRLRGLARRSPNR